MSRSRTGRFDPDRRRGLTLVEVVAALSIATILFLGMLSAVTVATRAMPDQRNTAGTALKTAGALDILTGDLHYAVSFNESTATAVQFLVADRNGDASAEAIRYAWSGVPGDPLTRTYNNGTAAVVMDEVQEFDLRYEKSVVHCTIRAGTDPSSRFTAAVRLLNDSGVPGP